MSESVSLKPFEQSHLASLTRWLASPPVARWYPDPEDDLSWASKPPVGGSQAIIARGALELGYVRWQRVNREALDSLGLREIPGNSVDIDILIGEESWLGRGIGTAALQRLIERLRLEGDVPLAGISPERENVMAIRSYEKAGFCVRRDYSVGTGSRMYRLMTLDLV